MQTLACLNGEMVPADEAKVSIWDRGFLFADSIYEVFRIYRGRLWLEAEHMARLERSLREMQFVGVDLPRLRHRIGRTVSEGGVREGTLYVQVTRGVAPRLHAFPDPPVPPTELILARPYDDAATARLRETGVAAISHADLRWKRCDVKSTNLLGNVLANEAAHRAGAYEAILVDPEGVVTEATHSSLLWVRDGRLEATPEGHEILPGTTRGGLTRIARDAGLPIVDGRISLEQLKGCSEVLLAGTTIEVLSICEIDGQPVGEGRPGPIARRLQAAFREAVAAWLGSESA